MQVLLGSTFQSEEGEIKDQAGKPLTLKDVVKQALLIPYQDEQNLALEEKVKRYDLYLKVKEAVDPFDATSDEIVQIKKLIGKAYGVLIVGQAVRMLEGK
jgi:hypothetical protein